MLVIILKELYSYSCCFLLLFIEILCFDTRLFLILPIFGLLPLRKAHAKQNGLPVTSYEKRNPCCG